MPRPFWSESHRIDELDGQAILWKRPDSKMWYLQLRIPHTKWPRPVSLKTDDLYWAVDRAKQKWREAVRKLDQGLPISEPTMERLFKAFMDWQRSRSSLHDRLRRHEGISRNHIIPMFGNRTLSSLTERDAIRFKEKRLRDGAKLSTVAVDLATLRDWAKFGIEKGYRKDRLRAPVGEQKPEDTDNSYFDIAAYTKMRRALRYENPELFLLVLFCYYTGCRVVEARNFRFEDLVRRWNPRTGEPVRIHLRGKLKKRTIPVLPVVQAIVERVGNLRGLTTGPVFSDTKRLSEAFHDFLVKEDLYVDPEGKHRTLGSMRHTRATFELKRELTTAKRLAAWMGHTSREQDRTYSKILQEIQNEGLYRRRPRR